MNKVDVFLIQDDGMPVFIPPPMPPVAPAKPV